MGSKIWMLVCSDSSVKNILAKKPIIDRDRTKEIVQIMFPHETFMELDDVNLTHTAPPDNEVFIGCFNGLTIIAASEFAMDYPSELPNNWLKICNTKYIYLHAMHSVTDWSAFATWENSILTRSFSISPDSGVEEDIGKKLEFEKPYWAGEHPVSDPDDDEEEEYPLIFHPLELGDEAFFEVFGFDLGGFSQLGIKPEEIPLLAFKRQKKHWWKFW